MSIARRLLRMQRRIRNLLLGILQKLILNIQRYQVLDDAKDYAKMKEDLLGSMILMKLNSISISPDPDREIPDDTELEE